MEQVFLIFAQGEMVPEPRSAPGIYFVLFHWYDPCLHIDLFGFSYLFLTQYATFYADIIVSLFI